MRNLKYKFTRIRLAIHDFIGRILRVHNVYLFALKEASLEIARPTSEVARLDKKNAIDVRSQLDVVDFDKLGGIVWIKVADDRMLRYDTFNQIRDYMRSHGKASAILLVTKKDVELVSLTDDDLSSSGLKRMLPNDQR